VAEVYENVLMSFKNRVTIVHYLPLFVPRRVRQLFETEPVLPSGMISGPQAGGS
jgi:hypothetical protein